MPLFKIDLNISIIYKNIKIEIPTKGNQNTYKWETKTPIKGDNKILTKGTTKIKQKTQNLSNQKKRK